MLQFSEVLKEVYANHQVTYPIKTIVVCDPGVDDALMLLQILNHKHYKMVGIIPVEGNASCKATLNNTLNICEYIGRNDIDIYLSTEHFSQKKCYTNVAPVYGMNGLSGLVLPPARKLKPKSHSSLAFTRSALEEDKHLIISTGPLAELSKILLHLQENNVTALKNIIALSIMGGVVNPTQEANWPVIGLRHTEANFSSNKTATKRVFDICHQHQIPIFLAPLDLTHSVLASANDVKPLKKMKKPLAELAFKLITNVSLHYQIRYERGPDGYYRQPLHDIHASNCLINPAIYYGQWTNHSVLLASAKMVKRKECDNIFLLGIHYCYRKDFFKEIITMFKSGR